MKNCRKAIFIFLIFNFLFSTSYCQWYDPDKVNKKAAALNETAYGYATDGNYKSAIANLNAAIAIEPKFVDAWLSKAGIYANMRRYDSSVFCFQQSMELDSVYASVFLLPYSISLAGLGQFQRALDVINVFLENKTLNPHSIKAGNYRKRTYEFAVAYEKEHPAGNYVFAPKNPGDSINSIYPEYYPSLTIDGKQLVFTRRGDRDEDFFESRLENGVWSKAAPLEGKVNTAFNEGAQNISLDGQWLIFTGCNYPEGYGSCDLYISYKMKNGNWSQGENMGGIINTDFWESAPSLSPDKRSLYFSSSQPGGYGGKDIWVSHRSDRGIWGRPVNLGPAVNTAADESCPFMYADNQTLFFNSNGHDGYGGTDLYFTKKQTDGNWGKPVNLGYPVNTIDEEGSLIVTADGATAWYASEGVDCRGALDLYTFQLRDDIRPPRTLWVKGKVYDAKTQNGLPSTVELTDLNSRQLLSRVQTDEEGNYLTTLPVGSNYAFNVNRKGYLFFSENYALAVNSVDTVFTADIPLQPIAPGAAIVLKNIFFDTKEAVLKPESMAELDKVVQLMTDNPNLKILISGHTDNIGRPQDNLTLSNARAAAVIKYLFSSGVIAKERVEAKGFGASKPVADNTTEAGRAKNRRTELSVVSN
ncbi:MAG TPA: OmpA family protein [Ferruginibacter sp.]|nr:OmpA family protein [Ferruginibacter sp.]HMP21023.1 OmpA family protein [Ferruginibacter sp.]